MATSLGLTVTGVVGILLRAKREGTIASLRKALVELETRAGFRIADGLVQQALLAADEATSDSD
ncbi:MAG: DUF3368 domain-containing protein [Anaerolineae bacterium]|nr:DUF3368 domain-containing protein [Anaerolineae bacterium]